MSSGHIEAPQADITTLQVGAIVNAANTKLFGGSGVCGAIFDAAGYQEMSDACNEIGGCEFGDAVITSGFKLPAKYVIHTVGPIYGQHGGHESDILQSCYWQSLQLAQDKELTSIAFPLISTGIYGYPKEDAVQIAIEAIRQFYEDNENTSVKDIYIVAFSDLDLALVQKHLR